MSSTHRHAIDDMIRRLVVEFMHIPPEEVADDDLGLLRAVCDHPIGLEMQKRAEELMKTNTERSGANGSGGAA